MALTVESAREEYASLQHKLLREEDKGGQFSMGKLAHFETLRMRHKLVAAYLAEHDPRFMSAQLPVHSPTFPPCVHNGFAVRERMHRKLMKRKNLNVK